MTEGDGVTFAACPFFIVTGIGLCYNGFTALMHYIGEMRMNGYYIGKLTEEMQREGFDAVLVAPGEELEFLTGFSPMLCERFQGLFVKADGSCFYICNLLYEGEFRKAFPESIPLYTWFDGDVMTEKVCAALIKEGLSGAVIGVGGTVPAFSLLEIGEKMPVTFKSGKAALERMRMIKTLEEMDALRDSAAIADRVFEEIISYVKPGMTEGDAAAFLMKRMTELGGKRPECIAAAGANASYPHYMGNSAVIGERDSLLLDFGCTYNGLYSDMTRMLYFGEPTEEERNLYNLVRRANEEAEELCISGAFVPDIDARAREVLDEQGYAPTLLNRLGHGIGYTVHEAPDIKQSNPIRLAPGMAFSIEPGIYIAGRTGIRVEDIVLINEHGEREVLNRSPKDMIVL